MDHKPLDLAKLSPAAQKALGAAPGRMMASRGLVPLPPGDQLAVLYQLSIDADQALAQTARTTAMGLPDKLLAGALADGALDPRIIDLFAQLVGDKAIAFAALVANPSIADSTVAYLAESAAADEIDRIATNEQRLLRSPEIIGAMYGNKLARMSTIDRVVELAVRNHVRVPGLAAWDEIARALDTGRSSPSDDALLLAATAEPGDDRVLTEGDAEQPVDEAHAPAVPDEDVPIDKMSMPAKIRLATLGDAFQRNVLIRSPVKIVALAAIKSPRVTEFEAAHYASNQALDENVIRYIAGRREWTKLYGIKYSLCRNPKTPVTEAMRLLPFLREKDLTNLSKSKGVPSAVVAQARKLIMQRRGPGTK
ncbi:MAG TPA: hypothetical protein VGG74_19560 [Kofleriaceae bacterium]|jgi:hypothetical protein